MDENKKFLEFLQGSEWLEINNLRSLVSYEKSKGKNNIYFCWWVKKWIDDRCSDDDIAKKKYFCVDIDVRLMHYEMTEEVEPIVLDQSELQEKYAEIVEILDKNWLWDYCALVDSWNWLHVYYAWEERSFDKESYSLWIEYIFKKIDALIASTWYATDHACKNISRITRMPWSMNPRKKIRKKKVLWDLWPIECKMLYFEEKKSKVFSAIEKYAEKNKKEIEKEKNDRKKVKEIIKKDYKKDYEKTSGVWEAINSIPANIIAEEVRDVRTVDKWLDNTALHEWHKNMGAYRWKPNNIIVNTWSSLIKTDKSYFTPYEIIYYEVAWQDKKKTIEYFKEKHWIHFDDLEEKKQKEKKEIAKKEVEENFLHISYKDKLDRAFEEIKKTDPKKIIKRWWDERDETLWWIYKGKIYTVWAETWCGKTTFVNAVVSNVAKQWRNVIRYSLEDRIEDQWKEELYDMVNILRKADNYRSYSWVKFVNNEYNDDAFWTYMRRAKEILQKLEVTELEKKKSVTIDNLIELMERACDNWADMFVIDHLHYFHMNDKERHDLQIQNAMHQINEIWRKRNVAIFLVAHYRNWTNQGNKGNDDIPSPSRFKDWAAIKQVSNIIIQITRDIEDMTIFHITKLRWRIYWDRRFASEFDKNTWEFWFSVSETQRRANEWFNSI